MTSPKNKITSPSMMDATNISSQSVDTEELRIGESILFAGRQIEGVTDDPLESRSSFIVSAAMVRGAVSPLEAQIDKLDNDVAANKVTPVISDPIISITFLEGRGWEHSSSVYFDRGYALLFNQNIEQQQPLGWVRVPKEKVTRQGRYFFHISVGILTSGYIELTNEYDENLYRITSPGDYVVEIVAKHNDVSYFQFNICDVLVNEQVQLNGIRCYYVKEVIESYLTYKASDLISGGSGFASNAYVNQKMQEAVTLAADYTNVTISTVSMSIINHINADNPHNISPQMIHAATDDHTHTPQEIGASPANHTHTFTDVGAAPKVHTHTDDEVSGVAKEIHTHTLDALGAAPKVHTHTPTEIGAAPEIHTHDISSLGAAPLIHQHGIADLTGVAAETHFHFASEVGAPDIGVYNTFVSQVTASFIETNEAIGIVDTGLSDHINNVAGGIPHNITASMISAAGIVHYHALGDKEMQGFIQLGDGLQLVTKIFIDPESGTYDEDVVSVVPDVVECNTKNLVLTPNTAAVKLGLTYVSGDTVRWDTASSSFISLRAGVVQVSGYLTINREDDLPGHVEITVSVNGTVVHKKTDYLLIASNSIPIYLVTSVGINDKISLSIKSVKINEIMNNSVATSKVDTVIVNTPITFVQ